MMTPDWKQLVRQHLTPLRLPPEREIVEELAQHVDPMIALRAE